MGLLTNKEIQLFPVTASPAPQYIFDTRGEAVCYLPLSGIKIDCFGLGLAMTKKGCPGWTAFI